MGEMGCAKSECCGYARRLVHKMTVETGDEELKIKKEEWQGVDGSWGELRKSISIGCVSIAYPLLNHILITY